MLQDDSDLNFPSITATVNASIPFSVKDVSTDVWHYRLGHISHSRISLLDSLVPSIECKQHTTCTVCPLAKQRRLSFPISTS
jgi:hypothetical protein